MKTGREVTAGDLSPNATLQLTRFARADR